MTAHGKSAQIQNRFHPVSNSLVARRQFLDTDDCLNIFYLQLSFPLHFLSRFKERAEITCDEIEELRRNERNHLYKTIAPNLTSSKTLY